jgi:hypothetical protein
MTLTKSSKTGFVSLLLIGALFATVGACVVWFLGADVTLSCQRSDNSCQLVKSNPWIKQETISRFPLSNLKSAEVVSKKGTGKARSKSKKTKYQLVLNMEEGPIPLSNVWTQNRNVPSQNAANINNYLRSSNEHLSVEESGKVVRIIGSVFFVIGLLALLCGALGMLKKMLKLGFFLAARR